MAIITISDSLAGRLAERLDAKTTINAMAMRAIEEWLDLTDGRGEKGGASAILLDEIGSSARGETKLPGSEGLGEWLKFLLLIAGLENEPG